MYELHTSQCSDYFDKELVEYNLELHTAQLWMDPYDKLRKMVGIEHAYVHNVEDSWANWRDDKEVRMRHSMCMVYFIKKFNLFTVPNQIVEDGNTVIDPWYGAVANLPVPLTDWNKEEVNDLNILMKLIEARTKECIDRKISQLKL